MQQMLFSKKKPKIIHLTVDGFEVEITLKPIKNMYLKVSRRTGEIRVSAPQRASRKAVVSFIQSRSKWIDNHLSNPVKRVAQLKYEEGEEVSFFGTQVPLKLDYVNKNILAYLHNNAIVLKIKPEFDVKKREKVLDGLYRQELKKLVHQLIQKWEPIMGVKVNDYGIRKMKTRWGTCNIRDKRIWLNLHLAKEKPEVIEMVVVHEMVHLLERLHNQRFYKFMDEFLPDWKQRSKELDGKVY